MCAVRKEGEYQLMSTETFINDKFWVFIEIRDEISKGRYAIIIEWDYRTQFMP